jgi:hypothetical protein
MTLQKGHNIGNRFSSTNQPKKNGRKPSLFKQLKEVTGKNVDYELSKEDYYKAIRYLMERNKTELQDILHNDKTQIWVCNIISAIMGDTKYGRTITVDSIFDRLFGRATQPQEVDVSGYLDVGKEEMTEEQILDELKRIDKALE